MCASGYLDEKEIDWITEVEEKSFEELSNKGGSRYTQLDAQLCAQLVKQMQQQSKELSVRYNSKVQELWKQKKVLTGRQVVWLIKNHWYTTSALTEAYTTKHLSEDSA